LSLQVSALLQQLQDLQAADPKAKCLVFSSWGRLLRLVAEALREHGIGHAVMAGAGVAARQKALQEFLTNDGCQVLLMMMSNSSGAAGLTLTVASTVFLLEPALNPGLEAQAAARVHRMGQGKLTRVVRLIAKDTVEERVLALQRFKAAGGGRKGRGAGEVEAAGGGEGEEGEEVAVSQADECDGGTLVRFFNLEQPLVVQH
jgi:E3 ubiquitin-protein ligase SHPRH